MISNDFIHELDIDFDLDYIRKLIYRPNPDNGMMPHQRLVSEDPYMASIKEKFPFLSSLYNIYIIHPGGEIPLHIDAKRDCAINIPIDNTENSSTIFWKLVGTPETEYVEKRVYHLVKSLSEETFRFTLLKPTVINNSLPHSVTNFGNKIRVIVSWSVGKGWDFDYVKNYFKNQKKML